MAESRCETQMHSIWITHTDMLLANICINTHLSKTPLFSAQWPGTFQSCKTDCKVWAFWEVKSRTMCLTAKTNRHDRHGENSGFHEKMGTCFYEHKHRKRSAGKIVSTLLAVLSFLLVLQTNHDSAPQLLYCLLRCHTAPALALATKRCSGQSFYLMIPAIDNALTSGRKENIHNIYIYTVGRCLKTPNPRLNLPQNLLVTSHASRQIVGLHDLLWRTEVIGSCLVGLLVDWWPIGWLICG